MSTTLPYYLAHETIYAGRLAGGQLGWDSSQFEKCALYPAVLDWMQSSRAICKGARVLELGCGTGALSCWISEHGAVVTGVDVSSSAILYAQSQARSRNLTADFAVANAADWLQNSEPYDLIIDAHMLHCLVTNADRFNLLQGVARSLRVCGEFWSETMLRTSTQTFNASQRLDDHGVVWRIAPPSSNFTGAIEVDGKEWIPERYLAESPESLLAEFRACGLHPLECKVVPADRPQDSQDFRARLHCNEA